MDMAETILMTGGATGNVGSEAVKQLLNHRKHQY
jgi:uncharacterized protein YbjT (DUF2867 family)